MKVVFDLDGTLCEERATFERSLAKPLQENINKLIEAKQSGHKIIIYTSRGWQEYEMTVAWLQNNNVPYDLLLMGKPIADLWIDDRAVSPRDMRKI